MYYYNKVENEMIWEWSVYRVNNVTNYTKLKQRKIWKGFFGKKERSWVCCCESLIYKNMNKLK